MLDAQNFDATMNHLNYEQIRASAEQRLAPRRRLRRRQTRLLFYILAFVAHLFLYALPIFTHSEEMYGMTGQVPNTAAILFSTMWLGLLVAYAINIFLDSRHERLIEKEIERQIALEKMRLEVALIQSGHTNQDVTNAASGSPKVKRNASVSDDGELIYTDDEELAPNVPNGIVYNRDRS